MNIWLLLLAFWNESFAPCEKNFKNSWAIWVDIFREVEDWLGGRNIYPRSLGSEVQCLPNYKWLYRSGTETQKYQFLNRSASLDDSWWMTYSVFLWLSLLERVPTAWPSNPLADIIISIQFCTWVCKCKVEKNRGKNAITGCKSMKLEWAWAQRIQCCVAPQSFWAQRRKAISLMRNWDSSGSDS